MCPRIVLGVLVPIIQDYKKSFGNKKNATNSNRNIIYGPQSCYIALIVSLCSLTGGEHANPRRFRK